MLWMDPRLGPSRGSHGGKRRSELSPAHPADTDAGRFRLLGSKPHRGVLVTTCVGSKI